MYVKIAIDGPSGAGKSSLAKALAKKLSFLYVDTGALYRAIGLFAIDNGCDTTSRDQITALLNKIKLNLKHEDDMQKVYINDIDMTLRIRTQEVAMAASNVSAIPEVREFLLKTQREIACHNNVIMDGRDVGTVILPDAQVKIYLTAKAEDRALRRCEELKTKDINSEYLQVLEDINKRDNNDSTRAIAPLKKADDAIILDNSGYEQEQTLEEAYKIIRSKLS